MNYFIRLWSSVPEQKCYFEWNSGANQWGRCVYNATSFPSIEAAQTALKEAHMYYDFIPPEHLSAGLHERLKHAEIVDFKTAASDPELKTWAPKSNETRYRMGPG